MTYNSLPHLCELINNDPDLKTEYLTLINNFTDLQASSILTRNLDKKENLIKYIEATSEVPLDLFMFYLLDYNNHPQGCTYWAKEAVSACKSDNNIFRLRNSDSYKSIPLTVVMSKS